MLVKYFVCVALTWTAQVAAAGKLTCNFRGRGHNFAVCSPADMTASETAYPLGLT